MTSSNTLVALLSRFTCPKKAVRYTGSFRAVNFFSADSSRKKGFQPNKSLYFCVSQQKKRTARKESLKETAILGHVNRLNVYLFEIFIATQKKFY